MTDIFDAEAREKFGRNYPEIPHKIAHQLQNHPLLNVEALAQLGESLPATSVEYNKGDLPIGIFGTDAPKTGMGIGDTIRYVETSGSWAVLKNIEQVPAYAELLHALLAEIKPWVEVKTGEMLREQGYIFVSSPGSMTPYHFDPEHNVLMQLRGEKTMTQFPAGDPRFASDEIHEAYQTGAEFRNLIWDDGYHGGGSEWHLEPGDALFVPVMAPHFVRNGPKPSISLSITWRSEWSFAEADARIFNKMLRKSGMQPKAPGRYPATNLGKAYACRAARRLRLI
jgi:hypothetical protein